MPTNDDFTFEISLSVLNHLGRNLYRSFTTVLGEAISNSWDADAENVWVYVDRDSDSFFIKDDGHGMTREDFQSKFLKIGYSKRRDGINRSAKGRPFIGRKGIGKLALLSCAERVSVISKTDSSANYVGGVIDNSRLDQAIGDDLGVRDYPLEDWSRSTFDDHIEDHDHGTMIYFENINDGIKNSIEFLEKIIALYFRFTFHDASFSIYLNETKIDYSALEQLSSKTEFLWTINQYTDAYISNLGNPSIPYGFKRDIPLDWNVKGFIASVKKPLDLAIFSTGERVGIDLFVNGRLRERNVLQHIPTSRVPENYLYGQIHYDELDDEKDRFTSSREGVVSDDPKYNVFLDQVRNQVILEILDEWDKWRRKRNEDGDSENASVPRKERKSRELFNAVSQEFDLPQESERRQVVNNWVDELGDDAQFNFSSYAECFLSENLIRRFIKEEAVDLTQEAESEAQKYKTREYQSKSRANISIEIRENNDDTGYLAMDDLAKLVDRGDPITEASLSRDAKEYKPLRDALAHTALLTAVAKTKLTSVYENIKGRVQTILTSD